MNPASADYLFTTPKLLHGVASSINLWGAYYQYNYAPADVSADRVALGADWRAVGRDIRRATRATVGRVARRAQ